MCIPCCFLNRMLQVLRDNTQLSYLTLTQSFYQDLNWFLTFLNQYKGITYFDNKKVDFDVHLDASLAGFGPNNLVVALKVKLWQDKKVEINCDN